MVIEGSIRFSRMGSEVDAGVCKGVGSNDVDLLPARSRSFARSAR